MVLSCSQADRRLPPVRARVFAARFADALRARAGRRRATCFACRDSAFVEAADLDSPFSAAFAARDRFGDGRVPLRRAALLALRFVRSLALLGGAGSFTPARLAFDSPIAMACLAEPPGFLQRLLLRHTVSSEAFEANPLPPERISQIATRMSHANDAVARPYRDDDTVLSDR
jgi:hypothetical protein